MHFAPAFLLFSALSVLSVAASPVAVSSPRKPTRSVSFAQKRGIVYDWTSSDYSKFFVGSNKVTFGSDYHTTRGETGAFLDPQFNFIPTLIVDGNLLNPTWIDKVKAIILGGAQFVFACVFFWISFFSHMEGNKIYLLLHPSPAEATSQTTPAKPT